MDNSQLSYEDICKVIGALHLEYQAKLVSMQQQYTSILTNLKQENDTLRAKLAENKESGG